MMKKILLATIFVGLLSVPTLGYSQTDHSGSKPTQKLDFKRNHSIKLSPDEIEQIDKISFEAFKNSSPEVQAALLKAAEEFKEERPAKTQGQP